MQVTSSIVKKAPYELMTIVTHYVIIDCYGVSCIAYMTHFIVVGLCQY